MRYSKVEFKMKEKNTGKTGSAPSHPQLCGYCMSDGKRERERENFNASQVSFFWGVVFSEVDVLFLHIDETKTYSHCYYNATEVYHCKVRERE